MAGVGGVGTHEGALLIAVDHLIVGDLAVEEDDGDVSGAGGLNDILGGIGSGGLHDVDDQKIGTGGDGGVDLVSLGGLRAGAVPVVGLNAQSLQLLVHRRADAGDIDIGEVIVEHVYPHIAGGSGSPLRGAAGGAASRAAGVAVRTVVVLAATSGKQADHHDSGQSKCKLLFHCYSSCFVQLASYVDSLKKPTFLSASLF